MKHNELYDWMKRLSECTWLYTDADRNRYPDVDEGVYEVAIFAEMYDELQHLLDKYDDEGS